MFGVAINMRLSDFNVLAKLPRAAFAGLLGQFVLLPAFTFCLIQLWQPMPSIALGMFLVAACPGGNISNFMTQLAGGNTALSIGMSAISTLAAIIMTPLNFALWAGLYEPTAEVLREISVDPVKVVRVITIILIIPLILGMLVRAKFPHAAQRLAPKMRWLSILIFIALVAIAFAKNYDNFIDYIGFVLLLVFIHNAIALTTGYSLAMLVGLAPPERKAVSIETGIQNSGLGLGLIFAFFEGYSGQGGMLLVTAWWGIWHIVSGLTMATIWSRRAKTTALQT